MSEPEKTYEEGRLDGMQEMADMVISRLHRAAYRNQRTHFVTGVVHVLADAFFNEIVACGDIIPEEFDSCWEAALEKASLHLEPEEA